MSETTTFIRNQISSMILNLNTAMPCKIISYNATKRTAKIQPLFMFKTVGNEPEKRAPLEDVPVLFQRYKINNNLPIASTTDDGEHSQQVGSGAHDHKKISFTESVEMIPDLRSGDIVLAVFSQRALDNVKNGNVAYPEYKRHHDIKDAIVIGVL